MFLLFRNRRGLFIFLAILGASFLIPKNVLAYNAQSGHPALTYEIAEFYNMNFDRKLTQEEIGWLMEGSTAEDTPPRWVNHFYNPITASGWGSDKLGNIDKNTLSWFSRWALSNRTPLSAVNWVKNASAQRDYARYGGDQSWYKALNSYAIGDEKQAFYAMGHVLHLLEDMTVPEHTRGDTHAGLLGDKGSPYEDYVKKITTGNIKGLDLAEKAKQAGYQPQEEIAIDYFLIKNAKYSHNNFVSEDTIKDFRYNNNTKEEEYGLFIYVYNNQYPIFKYLIGSNSIDNYTVKDDRIMSAYFERLGRRAVTSGAGALHLFFRDAEKRREKELKKPTKQTTQKNTNLVFSPFGELVKIYKWWDSARQVAFNLFGNSAKTSKGENADLSEKENQAPADSEMQDIYNKKINKIQSENKNTTITLTENKEFKDNKKEDFLDTKLSQANRPSSISDLNQKPQSFYVSRVIDGDTVVLNNGEKVRLIGMDTPEHGEKCFEQAKAELERLVLGKNVRLEKDKSETDRYNRLLRYIYVDEVLVNAEMLKNGYAHIMMIPPDTKYYSSFKMLQNDAKIMGVGCLYKKKANEVDGVGGGKEAISTDFSRGISYAVSYASQDLAKVTSTVILDPIQDLEIEDIIASSTLKVEDNVTVTSTTESEVEETTSSTPSLDPSTIIINEIQIAGENTKDEFIELYNTTTSTIDISGWSLIKKTKSGNESNLISSFPDSSLIPALNYFLIIPQDISVFTSTVTADTTYTGSSYSVAKNNTVILKDSEDNIIDKVGYGEATDFELAPTDNPPTNKSISRINFLDTDNNFDDFIITTSTPQGTSNTYVSEPVEEVEDVAEEVFCEIPIYGTHQKQSGSVNRSLAQDVLTEVTLAQFNSGETVTLTPDNNPYYIDDTLTVRSGSKLIIEAGVIIKFGRWRNSSGVSFPTDLIIQGDLEVNGTADNPVIFTTFRDDEHGDAIETSNTIPAPGDWGSVKIESEAGHSINIKYAELYYGGGSADGSNSDEGAIFINNSNADINISHTKVYYSGSGLYSRALSQPEILNNIFSYNNLWGISLEKDTSAKISGNTFKCNGISRGSGTTGGLNIEGDINGIELSQNNFIKNTNYGLSYYTSTSSTLDARGSYWGDIDGPYHLTNTSTLGDAVSNNILFSPWSTIQY